MSDTTVSVQSVNTSAIITEGRMRGELGNIDELANSISEFGLLVPIILADGIENPPMLVDGGRRLTALKRLGWKTIPHGEGGFIWLDEANNDPLRRKAIELETNLRRKELTWQEQCLGRKQLLETMQALHGVVSSGAQTVGKRTGVVEKGFGVRRLAAMLGISPATVSLDVQAATLITKVPSLSSLGSRDAVLAKLATAIQTVTNPKGVTVAPAISYRVMVMCANENDQIALIMRLEQEGYKCQPVLV
jgi:hypothetical protein